MREIPKHLRYTATHEWAKQEEQLIVVGITDHAQSLLGDLVYVELPDIGKEVSQGQEVAVVESVKAASDVYSPVAGEVVAVNTDLRSSPEKVNTDPYHHGWIFKLKPTHQDEFTSLLSDQDYHAQIISEEA